MIAAHEHTRAGERLPSPDVLQMARPPVLRVACCNALGEVAVVDFPCAREIVRTHCRCPVITHAFARSTRNLDELTGAGGSSSGTRSQPAHSTSAAAESSLPDAEPNLAPVLDRNIRALWHRREAEARAAAWQERVADVLTRFTGSMAFVGIHIVAFGLWIVANLGWLPPVPVWDPSFAGLAMVASVEAIFLSTFVLMSQNRMAAAADKRADLDLQISLLAEHEITRLAKMLAAICEKLGVAIDDPSELEDIKRDVAPEAVLDRIEEAEG